MAIHVPDESRLVDLFRMPYRLDAEHLQHTIDGVRTCIDGSLAVFGTQFPASSTVRNRYPLNRSVASWDAEPSPSPGANTGWTCGFWSGLLWLLSEITGETHLRPVLDSHLGSFQTRIDQGIDLHTHRLGLLYTPSCVAGWKLTGLPATRETALQAASLLMACHFKPAGIIQAWCHPDCIRHGGRMPVDSLLNLPLLFWASAVTGDGRFAEAARSHARQAVRYLVRQDGGTYGTFCFDSVTGEPLQGEMHPGIPEDSSWARGQAWAIYGLSLSYRYTHEPQFLETAAACANYFLNRCTKDLIACWSLDTDANSRSDWDSSASAIAVCGLLELVRHLHDPEAAEYFTTAAHRILQALADQCTPAEGDGSQALLLHGIHSRKTGVGIDEGNLWGDYFFLEALVRVSRTWNPYW